MTIHISILIPVILAALFCGWVAFTVGHCRGRDSLAAELNKLWRYKHAVDDLDRWCGHTSPHAKLIGRHLTAIGEGTGCNAGTPCDVEACTIDGLREQLKKLDVIESTLGEPALAGDRLRAAMKAYDGASVMREIARQDVNSIISDSRSYAQAPSIHPISRA